MNSNNGTLSVLPLKPSAHSYIPASQYPAHIIHKHNMSAIPPPPPIPSDLEGEVVFYFGFPFPDDVAFYRANVDPSWVPPKGVEPNLDVALDNIRRATRYGHIDLVSVFTDSQEPDKYIVHMLAVASAVKDMPKDRIARLTADQLMCIAAAAHLNGVRPQWLRSLWVKEDLQEMGALEL
ncbi:hypothetical protein FPV67DRAFT_1139669 [Lyophyllum atratum]|nr:hypothetical protein FPV67DRAFT_1139669 [Lyophyllum atratum]